MLIEIEIGFKVETQKLLISILPSVNNLIFVQEFVAAVDRCHAFNVCQNSDQLSEFTIFIEYIECISMSS